MNTDSPLSTFFTLECSSRNTFVKLHDGLPHQSARLPCLQTWASLSILNFPCVSVSKTPQKSSLLGCYSIVFLTEALYSQGCKSLAQNSHCTLRLLLHPFLVFDKCNVTQLHSCCCADHFPSLTSCPEIFVFTSHHCHLLFHRIKYSYLSLILGPAVHANILNPTLA